MPKSAPNCRAGTRPSSIIMNITKQSSIAVDRFSTMMSGTMGRHTISIYLKASLSAPFSVCNALSICAVASTIAPFAISDG